MRRRVSSKLPINGNLSRLSMIARTGDFSSGISSVPSTKAYKALNMREAAPLAGTNFVTSALSDARYSFQRSIACCSCSGVRRMMLPPSTVADDDSRRYGNPVVNRAKSALKSSAVMPRFFRSSRSCEVSICEIRCFGRLLVFGDYLNCSLSIYSIESSA